MFFKNAKIQMIDKFGQRECIDLEVLHKEFVECGISFDSFSRHWATVARTLRYPSPGQMRISDKVTDVIALNNTSIFQDDFEDNLEVLQANDINVFHRAVDENLEISTIGDLISILDRYS